MLVQNPTTPPTTSCVRRKTARIKKPRRGVSGRTPLRLGSTASPSDASDLLVSSIIVSFRLTPLVVGPQCSSSPRTGSATLITIPSCSHPEKVAQNGATLCTLEVQEPQV